MTVWGLLHTITVRCLPTRSPLSTLARWLAAHIMATHLPESSNRTSTAILEGSMTKTGLVVALLALTAPALAVEAPHRGEDFARQPPPVWRGLSEQGQSICFDKARILGWSPEQVVRCLREKQTEERMMRG